MTDTIAIVDYGSGNLRSAQRAVERVVNDLGIDRHVVVTGDAEAVSNARHIVLPGVGAYADCRRGLDAVDGMVDALRAAVLDRGRPFLGVCVGMQLLATAGLEHGRTAGLDWIGGEVAAIEPSDSALKIPHMGWNALNLSGRDHPVLDGVATGDHVYFVHSYALRCSDPADVLAETDYGAAFTAIVGRDTMVGTQFHPEKSQRTGLRLIANFVQWRP